VGNAHGEDARLAGAGAGEHQHWAVERFDREPLLGVQPGEIGRAAAGRGAGTRSNTGGGWGGCFQRFAVLSQRVSQGDEVP